GRRPPSRSHDQDTARDQRVVLGMVGVDQTAVGRIHPPPQAERLLEDQRGTYSLSGGQDPTAERGRLRAHAASHAERSLTTRPATADATHSAVLPNTTS